MTFSQELKEELLRIPITDKHEQKVQLIAAIKSLAIINYNEFGLALDIRTAHALLAKHVFKTIKAYYPHTNPQTLVQRTKRFNRITNQYIVRVHVNVTDMLYDLNLITSKEKTLFFTLNDSLNILQTERERMVYARTFFCASGTINDPRKQQQYHLEITSQNDQYLKEIKKIAKPHGITFKLSKRKNNYPLYLNKSEEIADFLKYIGATDMLFEFENYRITRDFRSANNRINNAEIANEMKQIKSSMNQIAAIEKLYKLGKLQELPQKTRDVAKLRLQFPDDSLSELADQTGGNISKSNISHHLKKIVTIAEAEE